MNAANIGWNQRVHVKITAQFMDYKAQHQHRLNHLFCYTHKKQEFIRRNKQQANLIRLPKINQFANIIRCEYKRNALALSYLFLLFVTLPFVFGVLAVSYAWQQ